MTLTDLLREFRLQADDLKPPYLFPDVDVVRWLTEAQEEACRRAHLLIDSTSAMTTVTNTANNPWVKLDTRILRVKRLIETTRLIPLYAVSQKTMDNTYLGWERQTSFAALRFIPDMQSGQIRLFPIPNVDGTYQMTVSRLPLESFSTDNKDAEPEIRRGHMRLPEWALYRAFMLENVDSQDVTKAQMHLKRFAQEFGETPSLKGEQFMDTQGDAMTSGYFA